MENNQENFVKISERYWKDNLDQAWNSIPSDYFLAFLSSETAEEKMKILRAEEREAKKEVENLNISINIKNEFAIKALENTLPARPTAKLYKKLSRVLEADGINDGIPIAERKFALINAFLNKYPYKVAVSQHQISEDELYRYSRLGMNVKNFKTIIKRDEEYVEFFTRRAFRYDENINMLLIPFVYSFVYMANLEDPILNLIMKRTKEDFQDLLLNMTDENRTKEISKLYTPRGLRSNELTREIKSLFSEKYFKQDSKKYKTLPQVMRKEIINNYIEHMLLEQTVYRDSEEYESNQEPQQDNSVIEVYNKMAEIFELRKIQKVG